VSPRVSAALAALLVAASTACSSGEVEQGTGVTNGSNQTAPSVQSSLSGLSVLPTRIRWTATTSVPSAAVRKVSFLVDGDRWWVDKSPPYSYGPEGADLPVRFVSSLGKRGDAHSFTVKVITKSGEPGSETVDARTPEAHLERHAPGNFGKHGDYGYFGFYGFGRLSAADLANPPEGDLFSSYTGRLTFADAGLFATSTDSEGQFAWEMASDGRRIYLGTPIYLDAARGPASFSGYRRLKAALCGPDAPTATYSWTVRRGRLYHAPSYYVRHLELRPIDESCDARREMLDGVWEEITD
jgi:hypothetical protein